MEERRRLKRIKKFFALNILSLIDRGRQIKFDELKTNPKFYDESGVDFNMSGIGLMCSKALPSESKIKMSMLFMDKDKMKTIQADGTIKWAQPVEGEYKNYYLMGVDFEDLSKKDKAKLQGLCKKYK